MEYILVLSVEPITLGMYYPEQEPLPLHCTLMHWFRRSPQLMLSQLDKELARISHEVKYREIELTSVEPALFGPNNDVPVHVLARNEPLIRLHNNIFEMLESYNSLPEDVQWVGEGYRPHVTTVRSRAFLPGTSHHPIDFALLQRGANRGRRAINHYALGGLSI